MRTKKMRQQAGVLGSRRVDNASPGYDQPRTITPVGYSGMQNNPQNRILSEGPDGKQLNWLVVGTHRLVTGADLACALVSSAYEVN
jgi:hypothetical protein